MQSPVGLSPEVTRAEQLAETQGGVLILARRLGISVSDLFRLAGLPEWSLQDLDLISRDDLKRLSDMTAVIGDVFEWADGPTQALNWYVGEPIPSLGGKTPQALVNSGDADALRAYLDHIAVGGFA